MNIFSRKFNRYKPYKKDLIDQENLKFVMFWGSLGKVIADDEDGKTIEFLKGFRSDVKADEFIVILADQHAKMNGMNLIAAYTYLQNIKDNLEKYGFKTIYLSTLWKKWNPDFNDRDNYDSEIRIKNQKLADQLKKAAKKYYNGNSEEGYKRYYSMRKIEKTHLENEFSEYVFLTYNSPVFREILPELPTLYIKSKKGFSKPPWIK